MIRGTLQTVECEILPRLNVKKRITKNWIKGRSPYSKGGTKFVYPDKYFGNCPIVYITIELLNLKYSDKMVLSPIITHNDKNFTIVRVNYNNGSEIKETKDNDVSVNIYSVGDPGHQPKYSVECLLRTCKNSSKLRSINRE